MVSNVHICDTDSENAAGNAIFLQGVAGGDDQPWESVPADVHLPESRCVTLPDSRSRMEAAPILRVTTTATVDEDNYWYGSYRGPDVQSYRIPGTGQGCQWAVLSNRPGTDRGRRSLHPACPCAAPAAAFYIPISASDSPTNIYCHASLTLNAGESGIYAYAGAGGTCTLPAISNTSVGTSLVGLPYWFTNVGSGPCTVATQAGQTFSGLAGVTSLTVPVGGPWRCRRSLSATASPGTS